MIGSESSFGISSNVLFSKTFWKACWRSAASAAAVVIVDEEIEVPDIIYRKHEVLKLPILRSAVETIGVKMSANIISCGAVNEALSLATEKSLEEAVLNHVPKGTEDTNRKAMQLGAQLVREAREAAKTQ